MFPENVDGLNTSMSSLRRHLESLGLFRRRAQSDVLDVTLFLQEQLNQHGTLHGYKFMHSKCIQTGLVVTRSSGQYVAPFQFFRIPRSFLIIMTSYNEVSF